MAEAGRSLGQPRVEHGLALKAAAAFGLPAGQDLSHLASPHRCPSNDGHNVDAIDGLIMPAVVLLGSATAPEAQARKPGGKSCPARHSESGATPPHATTLPPPAPIKVGQSWLHCAAAAR